MIDARFEAAFDAGFECDCLDEASGILSVWKKCHAGTEEKAFKDSFA